MNKSICIHANFLFGCFFVSTIITLKKQPNNGLKHLHVAI